MQPATRRPRGTGVDTVAMCLRLDRDVKGTLDELSQRLGVAKAVIVEELVRRLEVDEHGRPVDWPDVQGEIPMKT